MRGRGLLAGETARGTNDRWEMSNGMLRERLLMRRHARWSSCAWEHKMAVGEARSLAELGMFAQSSRRGQRKRRPGDWREGLSQARTLLLRRVGGFGPLAQLMHQKYNENHYGRENLQSVHRGRRHAEEGPPAAHDRYVKP